MNMKELTDAAYDNAKRVDSIVNELIGQYPPDNPGNYIFWMAFCRTVQTTIDITTECAKESRKEG